MTANSESSGDEREEVIQEMVDAFNSRGLGDRDAVWASLRKFQEMRESGEFSELYILSDFDFVWGISYERYNDGTYSQRRIVGDYNCFTLDEAIEEAYAWWWKAGTLDANSRALAR